MKLRIGLRPVLVAAVVAALAILLAACGSSKKSETTATTAGGGPGDVSATLSEYKIALDKSSAPAGKVTFKVTNAGQLTHEFVVIKTNKAPGDLPMEEKQGEEQEASEAGSIGEIGPDELSPGKTFTKSFKMKAGKYVIICNLSGHYMKGQYTGFTVT